MKPFTPSAVVGRLKAWLSAPAHDAREAQGRRLVLLNEVILMSLAFTCLVLAGVMAGTNLPSGALSIVVSWLVLLLFAKRLLQSRRLALATGILTVAFFVLITLANIRMGTIRTPTAAIYLFWVALVGVLFQLPGIVAATIASSLAVGGLILAENAAWLPAPNYGVGLTQWIVFTALFGMTSGLMYRAHRYTQRLLEQVECELKQRKRSESLLRLVIDNMPDPVFLKDAQGNYTLANQGLAALYHTTPAAMLGKSDGDFGLPAELVLGNRESIEAVLANGKTTVVLEDSVDPLTGLTRHYRACKAPILVDPQAPQVLVVAQEITEIVQSHRQVAQSEKRLLAVLSITREAVWDWHLPTGRVSYNRQWEQMLGFATGQIADTADFFGRLVHPEDQAAVQQLRQALCRGETDTYLSEHRLLGHDGVIWVQDRGGVLERNANGQVTRLIGSCTDITARHADQDRIALLLNEQQAILNSEVIGLAITEGRKVQWANPSLLLSLGYTFDEIMGKETRFVYPTDETFEEVGRAAYPVLQAGLAYSTQVQLMRKDGGLTWFALFGAPFGKLKHQVLWSFNDISAQKLAQEKLVDAQHAAEAASRAKSQFLATMSHEIRTPMNGILGMAQLLVNASVSEAERLQYAQTILNSGRTLLMLLNDILDLSKVEAGKLTLEMVPLDACEVASDIRDLFVEAAHAKGLRLESICLAPSGLIYLGDPARLRQMVSNLVGNAIKFTAKGFVRLQVTEIERQGRHAVLEFSVADSGIGVAPAKQALLFQAFSQADSSTTRNYGGTGLGLSIVRTLAELMAGSVGIDSEAGQGSRFWFRARLELDRSAQPAVSSEGNFTTAAAPPPSPGNTLRANILVAEDTAVNRVVIEALLGKMPLTDLTLTIVEDGQQALDFITQGGEPDLVLMDLQMPVMDGLTATARIRQWEATQGSAHLPIVALTANAYEEDRKNCMAAGMDDFLSKPLDIAELKGVLQRWLK